MAAPKRIKKSESVDVVRKSEDVKKPEDVAGNLYAPEDDPSLKIEHNVQQEVVRREFYVLVDSPALQLTDCTGAVVQEALNLGYRPTGDAYVESIKDHEDGLHKVVTWAVPATLVKPVEGDSAQAADSTGSKAG